MGLGKRVEEDLEKWGRSCCRLTVKIQLSSVTLVKSHLEPMENLHENLSEDCVIMTVSKCFLMVYLKLICWSLCPALFTTEVAKKSFSSFYLPFTYLQIILLTVFLLLGSLSCLNKPGPFNVKGVGRKRKIFSAWVKLMTVIVSSGSVSYTSSTSWRMPSLGKAGRDETWKMSWIFWDPADWGHRSYSQSLKSTRKYLHLAL